MPQPSLDPKTVELARKMFRAGVITRVIVAKCGISHGAIYDRMTAEDHDARGKAKAAKMSERMGPVADTKTTPKATKATKIPAAKQDDPDELSEPFPQSYEPFPIKMADVY